MENLKSFLSISLIVALFSVISCKKSDTSPVIFNTSAVTSGTWKVSSFHESSSDHTADFTNYVFTFDSNGTLTSNNAGDITTGSWNFDDSGNQLHLNIGSSSPLTDISKGWIILESTETSLKLQDDSSNGEELDFVKL